MLRLLIHEPGHEVLVYKQQPIPPLTVAWPPCLRHAVTPDAAWGGCAGCPESSRRGALGLGQQPLAMVE